ALARVTPRPRAPQAGRVSPGHGGAGAWAALPAGGRTGRFATLWSQTQATARPPRAYLRVTELIWTVEVRPALSQAAVAGPARASVAFTRPHAPLLVLRTWPGGAGGERFSAA